MLSSTIYLSFNAVLTAEPFSHKSRFIYYFMIEYYQEKLSFHGVSMKKL